MRGNGCGSNPNPTARQRYASDWKAAPVLRLSQSLPRTSILCIGMIRGSPRRLGGPGSMLAGPGNTSLPARVGSCHGCPSQLTLLGTASYNASESRVSPESKAWPGPIAQRLELLPHKEKIPGSNPGGPTCLRRPLRFSLAGTRTYGYPTQHFSAWQRCSRANPSSSLAPSPSGRGPG